MKKIIKLKDSVNNELFVTPYCGFIKTKNIDKTYSFTSWNMNLLDMVLNSSNSKLFYLKDSKHIIVSKNVKTILVIAGATVQTNDTSADVVLHILKNSTVIEEAYDHSGSNYWKYLTLTSCFEVQENDTISIGITIGTNRNSRVLANGGLTILMLE